MGNKKTKLKAGLKLGGEVLVVPGLSLLVDGKLKRGALHCGVGLLAGSLLGLPGLVVVAANSFSLSQTGRSLIGNLKGDGKSAKPQQAPRNTSTFARFAARFNMTPLTQPPRDLHASLCMQAPYT